MGGLQNADNGPREQRGLTDRKEAPLALRVHSRWGVGVGGEAPDKNRRVEGIACQNKHRRSNRAIPSGVRLPPLKEVAENGTPGVETLLLQRFSAGGAGEGGGGGGCRSWLHVHWIRRALCTRAGGSHYCIAAWHNELVKTCVIRAQGRSHRYCLLASVTRSPSGPAGNLTLSDPKICDGGWGGGGGRMGSREGGYGRLEGDWG